MMRSYPSLEAASAWPHWRTGDIIDVVAPAWACQRSELNGAVRFLKGLGLNPRVSSRIFSTRPGFFAQTDEERFKQLKAALLAKDSAGVWCLRGGYGVIRLLPQLEKLKRPTFCKVVIGYSDITSLHLFLNSRWQWPTIHGPLLDRFGRGANQPRETRELLGLLWGQKREITFSGLKPLNARARQGRVIKAGVIGGNLAVVVSSLGTPWAARPKGQIVFFEDVGERPHRLDRMLTQLTQADYFRHARALVFGSLLVEKARDRRGIWQDVLPRFAKDLALPVFSGVQSGHGSVQRPLPFLTSAELVTGSRARLTVNSGGEAG